MKKSIVSLALIASFSASATITGGADGQSFNFSASIQKQTEVVCAITSTDSAMAIGINKESDYYSVDTAGIGIKTIGLAGGAVNFEFSNIVASVGDEALVPGSNLFWQVGDSSASEELDSASNTYTRNVYSEQDTFSFVTFPNIKNPELSEAKMKWLGAEVSATVTVSCVQATK